MFFYIPVQLFLCPLKTVQTLCLWNTYLKEFNLKYKNANIQGCKAIYLMYFPKYCIFLTNQQQVLLYCFRFSQHSGGDGFKEKNKMDQNIKYLFVFDHVHIFRSRINMKSQQNKCINTHFFRFMGFKCLL